MSSLKKIFATLFGRHRDGGADSSGSAERATATTPDIKPEFLVVGLGNPGAKYAGIRHNIGYMAVDELLERHSGQLQPVAGAPAQVALVEIAEVPVALVRSTTYMNESGAAIGPLAERYGIPSQKVIVLHDELDIAPGRIRIKDHGGEGGHNGLKSATRHLGTNQYTRVRMGIGRPPQGTSVIDFVLSVFEADGEQTWLSTAIDTAADAVELIVTKGNDIARNDIHTR